MPHAMPNQTRLGERKKYLVWAAAEVFLYASRFGTVLLWAAECASVESAEQRWCASVGTAPRLYASSA